MIQRHKDSSVYNAELFSDAPVSYTGHPASWPNSSVTLSVSYVPWNYQGFFEPYDTFASVISIQGGIKPALVSVIIIQGRIKRVLAFSGGP